MAAPDFRLMAWLRELGYDVHLTPPAGKTDFLVAQALPPEIDATIAHVPFAVQAYSQSYGGALATAWDLVRKVKLTQPTHGIITATVGDGPYPFPDPDRALLARCQLTLEITCRI